MDTQSPGQTAISADPAIPMIGRVELITLLAMLMALNALAIDIMLPALPIIGEALNVTDPNHRQFIITAYLLGFGAAQLAYGPVSDALGRKAPLYFGLAIYVVSALVAAFAPSFALLLVARFVQGVGAAGTRVIVVATVRDIYGGRRMAEVMSLVMMVFMAVPVIAPLTGQAIVAIADWHWIFVFIAALGLAATVWTHLRLPETLPPERRRSLEMGKLGQAFAFIFSDRIALGYTIATSFIFGALFGFITSAQQVFVEVYGLGVWFPVVFAAFAGLMAVSAFMNSRLVGRIGMRRLSHGALLGFVGISVIWAALSLVMTVPFPLFMILFASAMFLFGWIGANFNAMAMEPLGAIAGTGSSVLGFLQTVGGGLIGTLIGQAYDGTVGPLAIGFSVVGLVALVFVLIAEKGRLFKPAHETS